MKTLLDCKKEYAESCDYDSWGKYLMHSNKAEVNMALNVVAQEYAKALLEEAAETIENRKVGGAGWFKEFDEGIEAAKQIIQSLIPKEK